MKREKSPISLDLVRRARNRNSSSSLEPKSYYLLNLYEMLLIYGGYNTVDNANEEAELEKIANDYKELIKKFLKKYNELSKELLKNKLICDELYSKRCTKEGTTLEEEQIIKAKENDADKIKEEMSNLSRLKENIIDAINKLDSELDPEEEKWISVIER